MERQRGVKGGRKGRGWEGRRWEGRRWEGRRWEGRGREGRGWEGRGWDGRKGKASVTALHSRLRSRRSRQEKEETEAVLGLPHPLRVSLIPRDQMRGRSSLQLRAASGP